jgi:hypothetical protein
MTRPRRRNQGRPGIGSARWDCKTSADEAALICRDDGLDAVSGAELCQHVAYVGLDGLHAEEQLGCDLRVGPALCDEPQDLGFAVGEVGLGEPATRRPAAAGREPADGGRKEQGFSLVYRADRVDEVVRGGAKPATASPVRTCGSPTLPASDRSSPPGSVITRPVSPAAGSGTN